MVIVGKVMILSFLKDGGLLCGSLHFLYFLFQSAYLQELCCMFQNIMEWSLIFDYGGMPVGISAFRIIPIFRMAGSVFIFRSIQSFSPKNLVRKFVCGRWKEINSLIRGVITDCKNYEEYDSMKYFRDIFLPFVKVIDIGMVQDEIPEWEKEIDKYIDCVEDNYKYEERKAKAEEIQKQWCEERLQRQSAKQAQMREQMDDITIYTYCGVLLPFSNRPYSFRTEDKTVQIGDTVIVPVGKENEEMEGKVVSVGQYARAGVPYPVEKAKFILKKLKVE